MLLSEIKYWRFKIKKNRIHWKFLLNRHVYLFGSNLFVASQRATNNRPRRDPAVPSQTRPPYITLCRWYHCADQEIWTIMPLYTTISSLDQIMFRGDLTSDQMSTFRQPRQCGATISLWRCHHRERLQKQMCHFPLPLQSGFTFNLITANKQYIQF